MYEPGAGVRCSAVFHLWVAYPETMTVGALGLALGTCLIMYPFDTPLKCDEFGGQPQAITAFYDDAPARIEDWCVLRLEEADRPDRFEEMLLAYPDFITHLPST